MRGYLPYLHAGAVGLLVLVTLAAQVQPITEEGSGSPLKPSHDENGMLEGIFGNQLRRLLGRSHQDDGKGFGAEPKNVNNDHLLESFGTVTCRFCPPEDYDRRRRLLGKRRFSTESGAEYNNRNRFPKKWRASEEELRGKRKILYYRYGGRGPCQHCDPDDNDGRRRLLEEAKGRKTFKNLKGFATATTTDAVVS